MTIEELLGITEDEKLWETIKHNRLVSFIERPDIKVAGYYSNNAYGDWLYVVIGSDKVGSHLDFYGLGYHQYRDRYIVDTWKFFITFEKFLLEKYYEFIGPEQVKAEIAKKRSGILQILKLKPPSPKGVLFDTLAVVGDEDGALSMMEDMGLAERKPSRVTAKCNFCENPAEYDAKTKMGLWGYLCEAHFKEYGVGLGLGKGQKLGR